MPVGKSFQSEQLDPLPGEVLREARAGELRHRGGRARRLPASDEIRCTQRQESRRSGLTAQPCEAIPRSVESSGLGEPALESVDHPGEATELLRRDALEVERVHEDVPAAVDLADEVLRRDLDAVEEDLAQVTASEHREA